MRLFLTYPREKSLTSPQVVCFLLFFFHGYYMTVVEALDDSGANHKETKEKEKEKGEKEKSSFRLLSFSQRNETRDAIVNNDLIEENLHVMMVISNPCLYKKRYILAHDFIKRMENEPNVLLYIVELIYPSNHGQYIVTSSKNPRHLQLYTEHPIWHKENMINLGIRRLLPSTWKAVAWIDADIEFESPTWATDTLRILNGYKDIVQLFSQAIDMNYDYTALSVFTSGGFHQEKKTVFQNDVNRGVNYWHPGFAWACTRRAYERIGGLYDHGILGSGDYYMMMSLLGEHGTMYLDAPVMKGLRYGYTPGVIRHYFHGTKKNRKYSERWKILRDYQYSFEKHMTYDTQGVIVPSPSCPPGLLKDIFQYFIERNEDDYL